MGKQKNGGLARAKALSPRRRKQIARKAAIARWGGRIIPKWFRPIRSIGETAREMTRREAGSPLKVLRVPLIDHRQMYYLRALADTQLMGQTEGEVAATFILEGIKRHMSKSMPAPLRVHNPPSWEGFKA